MKKFLLLSLLLPSVFLSSQIARAETPNVSVVEEMDSSESYDYGRYDRPSRLCRYLGIGCRYDGYYGRYGRRDHDGYGRHGGHGRHGDHGRHGGHGRHGDHGRHGGHGGHGGHGRHGGHR